MPLPWRRLEPTIRNAIVQTRHVSGSRLSRKRRPRALDTRRLSSPADAGASLYAELFPDEARAYPDAAHLGGLSTSHESPCLTLPTVDELLEDLKEYSHSAAQQASKTTEVAASDALRYNSITVLTLQVASKSLVESDFRRAAPKGAHIGGWTGPGDILKVFPARDPVTLEQSGHYFIVFKNPAYARAYQSNVLRLYRLARRHTPTSFASPIPLQRGSNRNAEDDEYTLVQDFALCPPSQRFQLQYLYPPLSSGMKRLLDQGGYLGQENGIDRAGRAVLFWVDGQTPTTREIKERIGADGRARGMTWEVAVSKLDTAPPNSINLDIPDPNEDVEDVLQSAPRRVAQRWILTFKNEDEARRFIRAWHRRHLPSLRPQEARIVHTEFLW